MRGTAAAVLLAAVLLAACSHGTPRAGTPPATSSSSSSPSTTAPAVPQPYEQLFSQVSDNLDGFESAIDAMPAAAAPGPGPGPGPVNAAELLPANGNRLERLLEPATVPAVDAWLDRFRALGLRGVTLGIKIPMLLPTFGPHGAAYADFFATVADHARARGLTVDVELGALFCNTPYASCTFSFDGNYQGFLDATVAQARIVLDRVHPDLLTLVSEPTTESKLTGVHEFDTPEGTAKYVHDTLAGIGRHGATRIGAGAASWLPVRYNQAILREAVDTLVLHVYPVSRTIGETLVADTELAQQAGKPVVADEIGLYKTAGGEDTAPATADTVYRRDVYSFWAPLDVRFLRAMGSWAEKAGAPYISVYWATQFFAYLDWTPQLDAAPFPQLMAAANAAASTAFGRNELTDFGRAWTSPFHGR